MKESVSSKEAASRDTRARVSAAENDPETEELVRQERGETSGRTCLSEDATQGTVEDVCPHPRVTA